MKFYGAVCILQEHEVTVLHLLLQTLHKMYSYVRTKQIENKPEQRS